MDDDETEAPEELCSNCDHMAESPHYGGYCYMFREQPEVVGVFGHCAQHTGPVSTALRKLLEPFFRGIYGLS